MVCSYTHEIKVPSKGFITRQLPIVAGPWPCMGWVYTELSHREKGQTIKDAPNEMSIYLPWCVISTNLVLVCYMCSLKSWILFADALLVVTELCCHKININTKEKDIIRSILNPCF